MQVVSVGKTTEKSGGKKTTTTWMVVAVILVLVFVICFCCGVYVIWRRYGRYVCSRNNKYHSLFIGKSVFNEKNRDTDNITWNQQGDLKNLN